jgi:hypothetical protein
MGEEEMSNKTEATFHPATDAGPPGQAEPPHAEVDPLVAEHWSAGEYPTGQLPVWAELAAQHGWSNTGRHEDRGDGRPWTSPEPPPWGTPAPGERGWSRTGTVLGVILVLVIFLGALGFAVQRMNWLPVGVPLIGKDSGVAACEAIAKGRPPIEAKGIMSAADYRKARAVFADSRYPAIRDNGVKIMDLAWQAQGMGKNNLGVLALMGGIADAYSGLAGGCSAVGYTIPSLGS